MVTIPTIDQISGTTVMNKMRSLINNYISFGTEVGNEIIYIRNIVDHIPQDLTNFYTKTECDARFVNITSLANYYTKTESDNRYYTKTESDNRYYTKNDSDNKYLGKTGEQTLNGNLTEHKDVEISTITQSTEIRSINFTALFNNLTKNVGLIQIRVYSDRIRMQFVLQRYTDTDGYTTLKFESYFSGRVALGIENRVNGVTTNHTILDSTP